MIGNRLAGLAPASGVARMSSDVLGFVLIADGPRPRPTLRRALIAELEAPAAASGATPST